MSIGRHPDVNGNLILTAPCASHGVPVSCDLSLDHGYSGHVWDALEPGCIANDDGDARVGLYLPSLGMDVEITSFYNSCSGFNGPFGYRCHLSVYFTLQVSIEGPMTVTLMRGNGKTVEYEATGCGVFEPTTSGVFNTLWQDVPNGVWKERTPDGMTTAYPLDFSGRAVPASWVEDAIGNRHTFSYDGSGLLQTLQDAVGRSVTFSYNGNSLLKTVTDWAGRQLGFEYDYAVPATPVLARVTGPVAGASVTYAYEVLDGQIFLTGREDGNGCQTYYSYDSNGLVGARDVFDGSNTYTTYYEYTDYLTGVFDPRGGIFVHAVDDLGRLIGWDNNIGETWTINRNDQGQITGVLNAYGDGPAYEYDDKGNLSWMSDALGQSITIARDDFNNPTRLTFSDGVVENMEWGVAGSPFDTTGEKRRLQIHYDGLDHATYHTYNSVGLQTVLQDALGHGFAYLYNSLAQQTRSTNSLGFYKQFDYDAAGNLTETIDEENNAWRSTYDDLGGVLTSTDPLGNTTQHFYDPLGNKTLTLDPYLNPTTWEYGIFDLPGRMEDARTNVTLFSYNEVGDLEITENALNKESYEYYDLGRRHTASEDELGHSTYTEYDNAGRVYQTANDYFQATTYEYYANDLTYKVTDANTHYSTFEYNMVRQQTAVTDPNGNRTETHYDAARRVAYVKNALNEVTTNFYDSADRLLQVQDPLLHSTYFDYDNANRQISGTDANSKTTYYGYDKVGRQTSVTDACDHTTQTSYDPCGRVYDVTDANGNITRHLYEDRGLLWKQTDPLGTTTYAYDEVGTMVARQDARLRTTTYDRDALNRIWRENPPNDAQITHVFDDAGRQTYLIDDTGTTQYHFDNADRQTGVDYPGGRSLAYELDAVGNRLQLTDPDSGITTYDYDPGNRLKEIHNPFSETTLISYDELNREKVKTLANGMTIHHTYDAGGRETLLQHKNSSGTVVAKYDSTGMGDFDAVGNRLKVRELDGSEVTFGYDCTYRLTSEVRTGSTPYTRSYEYDGTGNRTRKEEDGQVTLYHYGSGNRLMSQEPGSSSSSSSSSGSSESSSSGSSSSSAGAGSGYITYGYDANGNLLTSEEDGQTTTYNWDDDDQLAEVELPGGGTEVCTYSDGLRRSKTVGGITTHYIWNDDNLLQETNTGGTTQAQFTHDPDGWGGLTSQWRSTGSSFYGFDPQSNTRYLYNSSEAASDSYVLSAFGKMEEQTGSTPNPHIFGGEVGYESEGSGLHYVRARYYDERSGRWISRDPIGFEGGDVNLYGYCGNDPMGGIDASGTTEVTRKPIAPPSLAGSLVPIYGSGRQSIHDFQTGHPYLGTFNAVLAISDVFVVKALVVGAGKLAMKGAGKIVLKEGETAVVHLTSPAAKAGIKATGKVGGKWGVFALKEGKVPASHVGRTLKSLVKGDLSQEVRITGKAIKKFKSPPPVGPFSAARRAAGVVHAPLGSINIKTGKFVAGEIFTNGTFRQATKAEIRNYRAHQMALDYGVDSLLYGVRAVDNVRSRQLSVGFE